MKHLKKFESLSEYVIITSIIYKFRYIGITNRLTEEVTKLVNDIKELKLDWLLDIKQYGGTIQGVLNTNDIEKGLYVANLIKDSMPESTTMVNVGEIKSDMEVGLNNSKGFWESGRKLDKLVRDGKFGVYTYP